MPIRDLLARGKVAYLQGLSPCPQSPPQLWRSTTRLVYSLGKTRSTQEISDRPGPGGGCGKACVETALYTGAAPLARGASTLLSSREAHLPAERTQTKAPSWIPSADVHPCRAGHSQAPQGAWAQASLGLSRDSHSAAVQRRNRLSRSRDFDAVYRHGRSVSTRFLVLYRFDREGEGGTEARLGIAVPKKLGGAVVRNRIKRRLREVWRQLLPEVPSGSDYVLLVRAPLAEVASDRDENWLRERVEEILGKARA
jgi:ribonuclease P protein component